MEIKKNYLEKIFLYTCYFLDNKQYFIHASIFAWLVAGTRYLDICNRLSSKILIGDEYGNCEYWEAADNIDLEMELSIGYWEGTTKRKYFNYILIGSNEVYKLKNEFKGLVSKGDLLSWVRSLKGMRAENIYVGKGQADRPMEHLMQTLGDDEKYEKCQKIKETWKSGHGIIILKSFHHSTSFEASTREALLIDFFVIDKLTNIRRGTYYGKVGGWSKEKLNNMGMHIGIKFMHDLMLHRHPVFLEADIQ